MTEQQIRALIDYYYTTQPTPWANYVSVIALLASFGAVAAMAWQIRSSVKQHISVEWTGILDACIEHPEFVDPDFTFGLLPRNGAIGHVYEAFCYKCWSLADLIITNRLELTNPYRTMIHWVVAYHRDWLEANPYMFSSARFWKVYGMVRNDPLTLFRNSLIPQVDGKPVRADADRYTDAVDWDKVHEDYSRYIFGPFAPEMTEPDAAKGNKPRNLLLTRLNERGNDLRELRVADFGCGPGNILPFLKGIVEELHGVDISGTALALAARRAKENGIKFVPHEADIIRFRDAQKFDVIISANSILPARREDVLKMLESIRSNLAPNGKLYAILPAFDACQALAEYWRKSYAKGKPDDDEYVTRCVAAFRSAKKLNAANLSYADDGVHSQCFHTPESIRRDFELAKLRIVGNLEKVEYPWSYARKLDYGFFPDDPPIWDWFVEAEGK